MVPSYARVAGVFGPDFQSPAALMSAVPSRAPSSTKLGGHTAQRMRDRSCRPAWRSQTLRSLGASAKTRGQVKKTKFFERGEKSCPGRWLALAAIQEGSPCPRQPLTPQKSQFHHPSRAGFVPRQQLTSDSINPTLYPLDHDRIPTGLADSGGCLSSEAAVICMFGSLGASAGTGEKN